MDNAKTFSMDVLDSFDFEATKKNVKQYFIDLEKLRWEWAKLNAQKGLTANYDFSVEYQKQPYIRIGKDAFDISAKECRGEQLKKYISSYYWAISTLSDIEQTYIAEYFMNRKFEDEFISLLGFNYCDSYGFKKLKRSAVYKFADFLDLLVRKEGKNGDRKISTRNSQFRF